MITKQQQELLDNLTSQFENLNKSKATKGGLIDVGAIISQHDANQKRLAEIRLNNENFEKLREKLRQKTIKALNKDLVSLGLIAKEQNTFMIKVTLPDNQHICYTKEIGINVDIKYKREQVGDEYVNIYHGLKFAFGINQFDSIEDIINWGPEHKTSFQGKLRALYSEVA